MASRYGGITGSKSISEDFHNINTAFENVQSEMDTNKSIVENHIVSKTAHKSEDITYSGDIIGASNVKQALDNTKQTIDDLILGSGDSGPEVAAARGGHATLGDRLDASDAQVVELEKKTDSYIDPREFGAILDGENDDYVPMQAALEASLDQGKELFIPGKAFLSSSLMITHGTPKIRGAGVGLSALITKNNIPLLVFDTDSSQFYYSSVTDLSFVGDVAGDRSNNAGIEIRGTSSAKNFFNYNTFENLLFKGTYYGIRSTKSSGEPENLFNWNLFTQIKTTNFGGNNVEHAIKFEFGSGTGNVFDACNIVSMTSGFEWGGSGDENIGDITISDCQFGGGGSAIKAKKGATAYGSNITITGCQWDAGIQYSLDFLNMNGFTVQGCNWGGATSLKLEGCSNYSIHGANSLESTYGSMKHTPSNATTDLFSLAFNTSYESAYIEIVTFGVLQGVGTRISRNAFLIGYDGSTISVNTVKEDKTGTSGNQINHTTSQIGNAIKISAQLQGGSAGDTLIYSQLNVIGNRYNVVTM